MPRIERDQSEHSRGSTRRGFIPPAPRAGRWKSVKSAKHQRDENETLHATSTFQSAHLDDAIRRRQFLSALSFSRDEQIMLRERYICISRKLRGYRKQIRTPSYPFVTCKHTRTKKPKAKFACFVKLTVTTCESVFSCKNLQTDFTNWLACTRGFALDWLVILLINY